VSSFGRSSALILAIVVARLALYAETSDEAFAKLSHNPEYGRALQSSVLAYEDWLSTHCKSVDLDLHAHTIFLDEIKTSAGQIEEGSWKATLRGTACGIPRTYNVMVRVHKGKPEFTYMMPGNSEADLELQQSTYANLPKVVPKGPRTCLIEVLDTKLDGAGSERLPNGMGSPWREKWEIRMCDKTYTVAIVFIPDKKGASINIRPEDVLPN
jgi:hypothetical protein